LIRLLLVVLVLAACNGSDLVSVEQLGDGGDLLEDLQRFGQMIEPDLAPSAPDLRQRCGRYGDPCCAGDACTDSTTTCVYFVRPQPGNPPNWCDQCGQFGQRPCTKPDADGGTVFFCLTDPLPQRSMFCGCGESMGRCCPAPDPQCGGVGLETACIGAVYQGVCP
jgi:hypothetical protein